MIRVAVAVLCKENKILACQRKSGSRYGLRWEFPGGKQQRGETLPQCVRREIKEELDVNVSVGKRLARIDHAYSHFTITLHVYACRYVSGTPKTLGCRAWKWVRPEELRKFAFPAANQPVIRGLLDGSFRPQPGTGRIVPGDDR